MTVQELIDYLSALPMDYICAPADSNHKDVIYEINHESKVVWFG